MVSIVNRITSNILVLVYLLVSSISSESFPKVSIQTWSTRYDKMVTCSVDIDEASPSIFSVHLLCPLNKESTTSCYTNCNQQCTPAAVCRKLYFHRTFTGCNQMKNSKDKKSLTFHYRVNPNFIPIAGNWQCQYRGFKSNKIFIHSHVVTTTTTSTPKHSTKATTVSTTTLSMNSGDKFISPTDRQNLAHASFSAFNFKLIVGIIGAFIVSIILNLVLIGLVCTYKSRSNRNMVNKSLFDSPTSNGILPTQYPPNYVYNNSSNHYQHNNSNDLGMETLSMVTKTSSIPQTSGSHSNKGAPDLCNSYSSNPNSSINANPLVNAYIPGHCIIPGNSGIVTSNSYHGVTVSPRGSNYQSSEGVNILGAGGGPTTQLIGSTTGSDTQSMTTGPGSAILAHLPPGQFYHCVPVAVLQQDQQQINPRKSSINRSVSSIQQNSQMGGSSGDTSPSNQIRKSMEFNNSHNFIALPSVQLVQTDQHPSLMQTFSAQQRPQHPNSTTNHIDESNPHSTNSATPMPSNNILPPNDVHRTFSQPNFSNDETGIRSEFN